MLSFSPLKRILSCSIAVLAMVELARAADGTWISPLGGDWDLGSNWAGGIVAGGVNAVADLSTIDIVANRTIQLSSTVTVGTIRFGDLLPSHHWTINPLFGALVMQVSSGIPVIEVVGDTVVTLNAPIAGNKGIEVRSAISGTMGGEVILAGSNSFTGGLSIVGGRVTLTSAQGAGSTANTITVAESVNPNVANQLALSGGITYVNKLVIAAGASPLQGQGAIQQTGAGIVTVNGSITIEGAVASGGHFGGGGTAGNELAINGPITSSVPVVQGGGRVRYRNGGTGYTSLVVNGVALLGSNNGIAPGATVTVGDSADGSFTIGNFNQTLAGLQLGTDGGSANGVIAITVNGRNLTLTGNLTSAGQGVHTITGPSSLALGTNTPNITVADGGSDVDLTISAGITGTGGFRKLGLGALALNGAMSNTGTITITAGTLHGNPTLSGPLVVENGGTLAAGTLTSLGSVSTPALTLSSGAEIQMKVGTAGDTISAGTLTVAGNTTFRLRQLGGALTNGIYPLLTYSGASPNLNSLTLLPFGRASAALVDTGTSVAVSITGNDRVLWRGNNGSAWDGPANWMLTSSASSTTYLDSDDVLFGDNPATTTVTVGVDVFPTRVQFDNQISDYHLTGAAGIAGMTDLIKTGAASLKIHSVNTYVGTTVITGGTLEVDRSSGNLSATSGVLVAAGATLKLSNLNSDMTFSPAITGAGTVILDPNAGGVAGSRTVTLSGANTGFSGVWRLSPNSAGGGGFSGGTVRWQQPLVANVGGGEVHVDNGGQFWASRNAFINVFQVSGTGYEEDLGGVPIGPVATTTNGVYLGIGTPIFSYSGLGALRLENNSVLAGDVQLVGDTKIGIANVGAELGGTIAGGINGDVNDTLVIGGNTQDGTHIVIFAGNNVYGRTIVNGGSGAGRGTHVLQVGNGGTSGTLGMGDVILQGETAAKARIVFHRSDGYTLEPGQRITAAASTSADLERTQVVISTTGTGLTLNNHAIDLSDGSSGGGLYVGGVGGTSGTTGSKLNITGSSTVDVGRFYIGDQNGISGMVIQSGDSQVRVVNHMRLGSQNGARSFYGLHDGLLDFTPVALGGFPYNDDTATGNGGLWLGVEGNGTFHQTAGTLATNFLVLSRKRVVDGSEAKDIYQMDGGVLLLKHEYGIISRQTYSAINFNGGTVRAAAGVSPNLDTNAIAVQSGGVTLDTNGPSTFTLFGPLAGSGPVNLIGGGALWLRSSGTLSTSGSLRGVSINIGAGTTIRSDRSANSDHSVDVWSGTISGSGQLIKSNSGYLVLTGNASSFTGPTLVTGGRLHVPASFGSPDIQINDGASFGGEAITTKLKLGEATGARLYFDPQTTSALSVSDLTMRGASTFDFATAPMTPGPWTVLNYGSRDIAGTFSLEHASHYRPGSVQIVDTGNSLQLDIVGTKTLTWTGAPGGYWNPHGDNLVWSDGGSAENFYNGDTVIFGDGPGVTGIQAFAVRPWKTIFNANVNNYTLDGSISGPGSLEKNGSGRLTMGFSENDYSGPTVIAGGVLEIRDRLNLGDGSLTNSLVLSGGTLLITASVDLGQSRRVIVEEQGGTVSGGGSSPRTSISGSLIGSGPLTLTSESGKSATHILEGDASGYQGSITVKPPVTGGNTTLQLTGRGTVASPSITLLPSGLFGLEGVPTNLDLVDVAIGNQTTLRVFSEFVGGVARGAGLYNTRGDGLWGGPIELHGEGTVQMSTTGRLVVDGETRSGGNFTGDVVLRGSGQGTINGRIDLPGATMEKGGSSTWEIHSTNNRWASLLVAGGLLRLGSHNALPSDASLDVVSTTISTTVDLNGFNQAVRGLTFSGGAITNSKSGLAMLTIHQEIETSLFGRFSGSLGIIKEGSGNLSFNELNLFSGPLIVRTGMVTAAVSGGHADGSSGPLGRSDVPGRTITVEEGGRLTLLEDSSFGGGISNSDVMPRLIVNQGVITAIEYTPVGAIELNGGTLEQTKVNFGSNLGYQFRGAVSVRGTEPSFIAAEGGKVNYLSTSTVFDVADVTKNLSADLVVSGPFGNHSLYFGSAAGGLTKVGAGTMELTGINVFTGPTIVSDGRLHVTGSTSASSLTTVEMGGTLSGTGSVGPVKVVGGTVSPGASSGSLNVGSLDFAGGRFEVEIFGASVGQFDQLLVTGSVTITANAALSITLGYAPADGDSFLLLSNDGVDPIGGTALFTLGGMPVTDGTPFVVEGLGEGQHFELNYAGGDGNDVVLVTVPEPGSGVLLLGGTAIVLARRRQRGMKQGCCE